MAKNETTMASGESEYKPGTYKRGDEVRTADTAADAVALVFDGFVRQEEKTSSTKSQS